MKINSFISLNEFVKIDKSIKYREFINLLRDQGIIELFNNRNIPKEKYVKLGWFVLFQVEKEIEKNKFSFQMVRITRKGFNEIQKIIQKSKFLVLKPRNLYKDVEIYCYDFLKNELDGNTIVYEVNGFHSIFLSNSQKTELILKYNITENEIWLPK